MRRLLTALAAICTVFAALSAENLQPLPRQIGAKESMEIAVGTPVGATSGDTYVLGALCRLKSNHNTDGTSKSGWWIELTDTVADKSLRLAINWGNENFGRTDERRYLQLTVRSFDRGVQGPDLLTERFYDAVGLYKEPNGLSAQIAEGKMDVFLSSQTTIYAGSVATDLLPNLMIVGASTPIVVESTWAILKPDKMQALLNDWTAESVAARLTSSVDPAEGYWEYLDRDCRPEWSQPGGRYSLATVKNSDGGYDILYVDGAEVNGSKWHPLMIKGRLRPTIFPGNYDLEWYDAMGEPIPDDLSAELIGNSILRVNFPALHGSMRFSRKPQGK